jgi:spore coat polysaccharide biosynthesis predicted glycosyltransferase SpsG
MINSDKILFIPSIRHGNGTGHLRRCLEWSSDLKKAHYYLPSGDRESAIDLKNHPLIKKTANLVRHDSEKELKQIDWELIVLDNRRTSAVPSVLNKIPVIAIDETGLFRQRASYVLDILPSRTRNLVNKHEFSFLNFPETIRPVRPLKKILISFGGEDPGNLSQKILDSLDQKLLEHYDWSVILPHRGNTEIIPTQVQCLQYVEDLKNQLHHYDLVITSYGLTALEALASRVFVLLFNPGSYHDQLSRNFRIPYCPRGFKKNKKQLNQYLNHAMDH